MNDLQYMYVVCSVSICTVMLFLCTDLPKQSLQYVCCK